MARVPFDVGKIHQAMVWLQDAMAGQVRPAADIEPAALAAGIPHSTLAEARRRLHIRSQKRRDGWYWIPPAAVTR